MKRGFKAEAERLAAELRAGVGKEPHEPIDLLSIARHIDVDIIPADELVSLSRLQDLQEVQPDAFSAATFRLSDGKRVVVYNPLHSVGRTNSNVAHELAHVLLDHDVRNIEIVGKYKFLTCDSEQEEEADWLAGCLLLPRDLLYAQARQGLGAADIAEKFQTSEPMARFRLNASGVLVQLARQRKR